MSDDNYIRDKLDEIRTAQASAATKLAELATRQAHMSESHEDIRRILIDGAHNEPALVHKVWKLESIVEALQVQVVDLLKRFDAMMHKFSELDSHILKMQHEQDVSARATALLAIRTDAPGARHAAREIRSELAEVELSRNRTAREWAKIIGLAFGAIVGAGGAGAGLAALARKLFGLD